MKLTKEALPKPLYMALLIAGGAIIAAAVIWLHVPSIVVLVALISVAYPAFVYPGRFYLAAVAVYAMLVFSILVGLDLLIPSNVIYSSLVVVIALVVGEVVHRGAGVRSTREIALAETQILFEEAQAIAHVGHFLRNQASDEAQWSDEMFRIFGLDPTKGAPPLEAWRMLIHPEDRERVTELQRSLRTGAGRLDFEYRIIRADGQVRYLHSHVYSKDTEAGMTSVSMGTVTDITERALAQRAVRESEERIRKLIESAPVAIVVVDTANRIIQANAYVEVVFGYTPDEVIGQTLDMLLTRDDQETHIEHFQSYVSDPEVRALGHSREVMGVGKGGKKIPIEVGLTSMEIKGQIFAIAWIADISVRRATEDALRESEQYARLLNMTSRELSATRDTADIHDTTYRAIAQVMDCDGLIISLYSPDDRMIRAAYARIESGVVDVANFPVVLLEPELPASPSAVIRTGQPLIVGDIHEHITLPETNGSGQDARSTVIVPLSLDNEVVGVMQVFSYKPDAYTEPHMHFLESLAAHIVLARKNSLLFQQVQQELTERKHAERALQISEERYRTISDLTSDYAYSFRIEPGAGRYLEWVAGAFAQITGYSVDDLNKSTGWAWLVNRQDIPTIRRHARELKANRASVTEFRIATRDRGDRWLRDYARPVWDEAQGRVVRIIGAVQDVTDRKDAEEALIESEKLYRSVFEGTSVGLGIVDAGGQILAFNDAVLQPGGYARADLETLESVADLYYDLTERDRVLKHLREAGKATREPVLFKRKDGTPYDALLTLIPISIKGKPALHAMIEDLSEQKRTESEIRRLFSAQERHLAELEALRRVTLDITGQLDLNLLLEELIKDALALLDTETGGIYLYRPAHDDLELQLEVGTKPEMVGTHMKRGEGLAGRILESRQPMIVDDYAQWEGRSRHFDSQRFGAILGVPITWGNQMLGVITAIATTPGRTFSRDDAGLLARFADQAAIAVHNARLYETEQKARMIAEILYATSVALSQSINLEERLHVFLKNLQTLIPFDSANLMLLEPDGQLSIKATVGYDDPPHSRVKIGSTYPVASLVGAGRVIESLRTIHIGDTSVYEDWIVHDQVEAVKCWIGVPLVADGEVIGLYSLDGYEANRFTEEHRYAAEALAAPAAIAIQNARLFESETRQLKLAQTLQKVGALFTTKMQLEEVFENIFDLLAEVVQFDSGSILLEDEGGNVTLGATRGVANVDKLTASVQALSRAQLDANWLTFDHVQEVNDTRKVTSWIWLDGADYVRSWIGVPLFVRGKRIGILNVDSARPNAFPPGAAGTVAAFANQAAVAIENARLFSQSEDRNHRLQLLNEITRIGTETLDLNSLLQRIVKIAAQLIGGDSAAITLWDDKERLKTIAAISGGAGEPLSRGKLTASMESLTATALREGQPLAIEDYYPHGAEGDDAQGSAGSSLLLPLQVGQLKLGALFIDFETQHHFTDDEIAWSSQAAELIALAVSKAEVYEDLERRVEDRTAELKAANDRLVALTRLKDEFVSNVSHELRTPIASIKLYHSLVSLRPEKQDAYLEHLHRETRRLENIVEGLLHLSRLDQGRMEVNMEQVELDQLAEQFVADRVLLAEARGLTLTLTHGPKPRPVSGDPALLGQAISVLFTNALNYTPDGGSITIETVSAERSGRPGAALIIQDSGPGISPEELPRLFERFFRGAAARSKSVPGTGLGLAIAHEIVEWHSGAIEVSSSGQPGEGARFTIWLPGAETEPEHPGPDKKIPRPTTPGLDVTSGEIETHSN